VLSADGSLVAVVVYFDATICQEELETIPVFGDTIERFGERRLCRDPSAVMD